MLGRARQNGAESHSRRRFAHSNRNRSYNLEDLLEIPMYTFAVRLFARVLAVPSTKSPFKANFLT